MLEYPFEDTPESGQFLEVAPGILWLRMPLPMDLDHINLYLLEDTDGWWVVDTGIALDPTQELWEGVFDRVFTDKPLKAVISTHYHPDHTGMAGWLCERWRAPFYMTQGEYFSGLAFSRTTKDHYSWTVEENMRRIGYSAENIDAARENFGGFGPVIKPMPTTYHRLFDGMHLDINDQRWQVVVGRGHSPEHACLYNSSDNVLLSGDQVIPRITSNISVSGFEPNANPLRDWFQSLEHLLEALPADTLVLPAHNTPFRGLHERLRYLIDHHEEHLLALEEACVDEARTVMELLPVMFSRELNGHNLGLAAGECLAHMNYLHQRGQLQRNLDEHGAYRYSSVDSTLPQRRRARQHGAADETPIQV
jgi:glyoxylase-like metal-dependent hydrolase (beta-lactamase superfamily II)